MAIDPLSVTAFATVIYGFATFLLWWENRQDRKQRDKQFGAEAERRKLNDLHTAFYDAWGHWEGFMQAPPKTRDAAQAGRMYEALIRFECQLRLNDFKKQANDVGLVIRTDIHGMSTPLAEAGVALGLLPSEYRRVAVAGFHPPTAEPRTGV